MTTDTHWKPFGLRTSWLFALVVVGALLVPLATQAQDRTVQALMDRIDRLERDIRTLNVQMSRGGSAPLPASATPLTGGNEISNAGAARINDRLSVLESDLRTQTGRNEQIVHRLDSIESRLDKLVSDIDYRLSALERSAVAAPPAANGLSNASAAAEPGPSSVAQLPLPGATQPGVLGSMPQSDLEKFQSNVGVPSSPPPSQPAASGQQVAAVTSGLPQGTPQEQYAFARSFLFKQQYGEAERALSQFLEAHPSHALSGNARYWLGETFYVRDDFARAAGSFLEGYQKEPKGSKAPDTLLKLGMSLTNLDKAKEACAAFNKLRAEFPDASPNIQDIASRERQRANCS